MDCAQRKDIEDYLDAVESQLNLLESTPLTAEATYPWPKEMADEQLFLQNQNDIVKDVLDDMDEDTLNLKDFKSIKPIISKGEENTDRTYILGLCDEILGELSLRQYPCQYLFKDDWVTINVDAYYMAHNLIIGYYYSSSRRELPHDGTPIVDISYKDLDTSRKLKRDVSKDKKYCAKLCKNTPK